MQLFGGATSRTLLLMHGVIAALMVCGGARAQVYPGTPREIVRRLNAEAAKALTAPGMREQFAAMGAEPIGGTPEEFSAVLKRDLAKWARMAREANVKAG